MPTSKPDINRRQAIVSKVTRCLAMNYDWPEVQDLMLVLRQWEGGTLRGKAGCPAKIDPYRPVSTIPQKNHDPSKRPRT